MECPFCKCQKFYIKDENDEFETYEFDCESGEVCFDPDIDSADTPELSDDSHIYCNQCAWNGRYSEIK